MPTPGQDRRRAVFGALDARTGALQHAIRERKRAADGVALLEQLARAYPTGVLVLVLDNVVTHDAKPVRARLARPEHARFRLFWLPKYSAHEHNRIERAWGLMQDKVAADRLHGSIEAPAEAADRSLAETRSRAPHPQTTPATAALTEAAREPCQLFAHVLGACRPPRASGTRIGAPGTRIGGHPLRVGTAGPLPSWRRLPCWPPHAAPTGERARHRPR